MGSASYIKKEKISWECRDSRKIVRFYYTTGLSTFSQKQSTPIVPKARLVQDEFFSSLSIQEKKFYLPKCLRKVRALIVFPYLYISETSESESHLFGISDARKYIMKKITNFSSNFTRTSYILWANILNRLTLSSLYEGYEGCTGAVLF